ncbi:FG-GAP-like repeat-containing protein [Lysobacter solisilvae (ex Woo and Kim 2020)]|uniref:VCBS repeat-containing protein n=1 Tax=Agrilutibacter terrestris TaxID=2865112 RepID=A0A7H0FZF2_9GAMM|nr:FG-GAP-like repeat-containing protein [Lysobacter terrestris]QNP41418.1 VCBS repeat-containing protein [Lysobacter terrestris]
MKIRFAFLVLVLGVTACSSDSEPVQPSAAKASISPKSNVVAGERQIPAAHSAAFASLPDRGNLVGYAATVAHREGPSIWYRADVSEEHALRAIVTGQLRMATPDGQVLDYRYRRHVEHANGNWTWIGELRGFPGREAILTFGERAAFGTFGRPGEEALRLTVRDGVSWIVKVPRHALSGVESTGGQSDYLLPVDVVEPIAVKRSAAADVTAATTNGTIVDVVLGYTPGFAAAQGGQSQAVTRLTHLVAISNEAYARSQLNAQIRLVGTLQVNYTDETFNDTALNEVSGSDGTNSVTVPAGLQPLRQARDQLGADLVSLVRKFRHFGDPEHDSCGVAWLVGQDGQAISSAWSPWGYSVVSDGSDGGYFCREETFAHELGHNMGQNHNVEDAGGAGAHPDSYGYREASATGFYTIMAYRSGDSQYSVPYFANPNVNFNGRPTGVVNASNNVRSMALTMPIIATFRATVVPLPNVRVPSDVNGDGKSDVLLRTDQASSGNFSVWLMNGTQKVGSWGTTMAVSYRVAATGDFNGDNKLDVVWTSNNADVRVWLGTGAGFTPAFPAIVGSAAGLGVFAGAGDVNGDGKADLLFRNGQASSANFTVWLMNGAQKAGSWTTTMAASYRVATTGDFNGDGMLDIVWTSANNDVRIWLGTGTSFTPAFPAIVGTATGLGVFAGAGDVNGDGKSDLLFRNDQVGTGNFTVWLMNGAQKVGSWSTTMAASYRVASTGDFNGDGKLDIAWTSQNRDLRVWTGTGAGFTPSFPTLTGTYVAGWTVINN